MSRTCKQDPLRVEQVRQMGLACRGKTHSAEHRAKMSLAHQQRPPHSAETREKISRSGKGKHRGPLSAEHRAKLSAIRRGRRLSPEHRAKLSLAGKGRSHSAESRMKMSAIRKARSGEQLAKIQKAKKGKPCGIPTNLGSI